MIFYAYDTESSSKIISLIQTGFFFFRICLLKKSVVIFIVKIFLRYSEVNLAEISIFNSHIKNFQDSKRNNRFIHKIISRFMYKAYLKQYQKDD